MLYPDGLKVSRYCVHGFFRNQADVDKEIAAIDAVNAILGKSDDRVCGREYLLEIRPELPPRLRIVPADDRPYYVLTRKYRADGECIKGRRTFKTRRAQARYIANAPQDIAITAYN